MYLIVLYVNSHFFSSYLIAKNNKYSNNDTSVVTVVTTATQSYQRDSNHERKTQHLNHLHLVLLYAAKCLNNNNASSSRAPCMPNTAVCFPLVVFTQLPEQSIFLFYQHPPETVVQRMRNNSRHKRMKVCLIHMVGNACDQFSSHHFNTIYRANSQ